MLLPVLLIVLAALSAWYFYGQPQENVAAIIDYVESEIAARSQPGDDAGLTAIPSDLGQAASTEMETADDAAADAVPVIDVIPADILDEEPVVAADESLAIDGEAIDEAPGATAHETSSQAGPEVTLIHSVSYVSERDGAARIATRHPGGAAGQLFWWTADNTAVAEYDYIPIAEPLEAFTTGEVAETVHIPLVNDSIPEPVETFYVYLGRFNAQTEQLEPVLRVRVEINDDD